MTNPVDRLAAALSDRYRIERELGAGGMATVYLAHDLKHDRNVALKVLRPELAAVIGAERFLAEIKTTANLQHPHILPLHDSGEVNGTVFYVMPYVEGESLRDRLSRERQLPIDDALRITTQVAGALDYAHRHGVIHRDIKPENILLHDGQALVADFGIALAAATTAGNRLTETGMSLGTPTYMSPEQAMGERHIDARSDVYALACVLYEMLTGDPPFTGSSAQAIVAKVLTEKPASVRKFRDTVPPTVDAALMAALAKLPADRFEGTAQFAAALADRGAPSVGAYVEPGRRDPYARIFWPALAGVFLVAAILAWFAGRLGSTSAPAPGVVFTFATPATAELAPLSRSTELGRVALSPDGTMLVYAGLGSDTGQVVRGLFRRRLDGLGVTAIPGTDSAAVPMFSPDGSWIAYYTGQRLVRIPATGGAATTIADSLPGLEGAAWLSADSIVFARAGRLWLVGADGGAIRRVSRDSLPDTSQPLAVAGGKDVVFFACDTNPCEAAPVMVLNVATGRSRVLVPDVDVDVVRELGPDVLTLVRDNGSVQGIRYDPSTMRVQGKPVVLPAPAPADVMRDADFDLSPTGVAAVAPSADEAGGDLVWVDRAGHVAPVLGRAQKYLFPRVSPDGRKIAMEIHDATDNGYIWVYDVQSQTFTRITDRGHSTRPAWSTDGKQLAYVSLRGDSTGIFVSSADLSTPERPLWIGPVTFRPLSWSPDGRWLATDVAAPANKSGGAANDDIVAISVATGAMHTVLGGPADQTRPVFSPDGHWIAYASNESGRTQVYVTAFPNPGGRFPITSEGGDEPVWGTDLHHLFYRAADGTLTDATIAVGGDVTVVHRTPLFQMALGGRFSQFGESPYDVAPGDQRFIMVRPLGNPGSIVVATGWAQRALAAMRAAGNR